MLSLNGPVCLCGQYGTTSLIWASRKGHYDCVMHLLEKGADIDQEGAVCPHPATVHETKQI